MDTSESPVESIFSPYKVKVGDFEGPLDLLLQLIEVRKLFINEISLSEVTNDYISYIKQLPGYSLLDTTHFVIIASTLILIKSRSLLPTLDLTVDEKDKIVNLEDRLKLYQVLRRITESIEKSYKNHTLYERQEKEKEVPIFVPDPALSKELLRIHITDVFRNQEVEEKKEKLHEVQITRVMSIDEMMTSLEERVQRAFTFKFSDLKTTYPDATEKEIKVHAIVSFLALLELVRNGIIDVLQNNSFEDMTISNRDAVALRE
jgi:segregation and condensation protein A